MCVFVVVKAGKRAAVAAFSLLRAQNTDACTHRIVGLTPFISPCALTCLFIRSLVLFLSSDDASITWNNYGSNGWWTKDGYDSHSTEIEVNLLGGAYCFDASQTYHLWYAEDVHDASESDNHGTAYTDVYIKLACALGYYPAEGTQECTGEWVWGLRM